jgi:FkbM family methyltransferase
MLINLRSFLQVNHIPATGIIHVGAHHGQEYDHYIQCGFEKIIFIEPQKEVFKILAAKFDGMPGVELYNFACGSKAQEVAAMYCEDVNQGQSSSLLKPDAHLWQHPEIKFNRMENVSIFPLDFINTSGCNVLMMDVQGFELEVLKGADNVLKNVDVVYTEVNRISMYEDCAHIGEMDAYLSQYGFQRKEVKWAHVNLGWGDAIYLKIKS